MTRRKTTEAKEDPAIRLGDLWAEYVNADDRKGWLDEMADAVAAVAQEPREYMVRFHYSPPTGRYAGIDYAQKFWLTLDGVRRLREIAAAIPTISGLEVNRITHISEDDLGSHYTAIVAGWKE